MSRENYATINGNEYYRLRKTIGRDKEGEPIIKPFYGKNKRDAEGKYLKWRDNRAKGLTIDKDQSLTNAMNVWLWQIERMSGNKSTTFARYEVVYRLDIDGYELGFRPLAQVDKLAVQAHFNALHNEGKSYSKIKECRKLLNKFFSYCLTEGYMLRNPCYKLKLDAYKEEDEFTIDDELEDEGKIETLSEKEIRTIFQSDINRKLKILVKFAVGTGLRQGEILALNKSDVNMDKLEVTVTKTLAYVKMFEDDRSYKYKLVVTKPKTKTSRRKVSFPSSLLPDLKELNKIRLEEQLQLGSAYTKNDLLFPSETGTYMYSKNLTRSWQRALERLGLPIKTFHALRHTFASQLIQRGENVAVVSRLLGHSTIKTTERYIHVVQATKRDVVQSLNDLYM